MKLSQTLLCLALAVAAASAASVDVSDMHKKLAAVDHSLAAISSSKASTMGYAKDDYYKDDYYKYESKESKYGKKYDDKYEDKYGKKYDDKYEDKYEKKYEDKYEKYDKYEDKYEKKYDDKYEDKYEKKYDDKYEYSDKYYEPKAYEHYGYGDSKITVKLWEKTRGDIRRQEGNDETYQFTSIVTCDNPKHVKDAHSTDGIIDMPVNPELKVTPVGQCEWTVTKVTPQKISEHASIKGSTSVVCTFTEEAERQCKGDFLCDKMSVSAAGLLYHFDQTQDYSSYKKDEYKKGAEVTEMDMDVMLSLINGVNGHKNKGEYDNGVVQFFYGAEGAAKPEIKKADYDAQDATGSMTMVFKKA